MSLSRRLVVLALVAGLLLSQSAALIFSVHAPAVSISIHDFAFNPQNAIIGAGTTVTWTNNDPVIYTLWFTNGSDGSTYLFSDPINPGATWTHRFLDRMVLNYYDFDRLYVTGQLSIVRTLAASANASRMTSDVGQLVRFGCSGVSGVPSYSYSWMFGDGGTSSSQNSTHTYNTPGIMNATCIVTDSQPGNASQTVVVTVSSDPTISTPNAQPILVDAAQSVSFTTAANGGSGGYTYSWLGLPPGCASSDTNTILCTPTTAGAYTVSVNLTDSNGFNAASGSLTFTVHSDPTVTSFSSNSTTLSQGQGLSFTVTANGGTGPFSYSYSGLPPGCSSMNTATFSCTPSSGGRYRVGVTVTDAAGKSSTTYLNITVSGTQPPSQIPLVALIGAVVVAVGAAIIAGILIMRRRRKSEAKTA